MQKITGKYASAAVFSDTAEAYALAQVRMICSLPAAEGCTIALMPDIHPGKVGPVGLTMRLGSSVMPALVGADIGCGISYIRIRKTKIEYQKLDRVIRESIPVGSRIRKEAHLYSRDFDFDNLCCRKHIDREKAERALGTLGGGNHFIEVDEDGEGNQYVFIHSGSRRLGGEVTQHYLREGQKELKRRGITVPYELTFLDGQLMEDYLHDMREVTGFAMLNREIILYELAKRMKWKEDRFGMSIHNYVDENRILRKGACQAYEGDEVIVPVNMRDGILLGSGKGNPDWNYSAPHGAGRVVGRKEAQARFTLPAYRESVRGVYSTTVCRQTLDEAPSAYRGIDEILAAVGDSVSVEKVLKPVYNYKATEERR